MKPAHRSMLPLLFSALLTASVSAVAADTGDRTQSVPAVSGTTSQHAESTLLPWSDSLFAQVEKEHGALAAKRLRYVYDTARANQDKPVLEKLNIANSTLNKLPWVADQQQWNSADYWATPFEILTKAGGDCEDMAIGKYVMLRMMGVPRSNLFLGYGKLKARNEAHMVLVWANDQRTDLRILDSFVKDVKTGRERSDLVGIYFTNIEGQVALIEEVGGKRKVKAVLTPKRMEKLDAMKQHILDTREKYRAYNEGQPLFRD